MLTEEQKAGFGTKSRGVISKGVVVWGEDARSHNIIHTTDSLEKLRFELPTQPSYSSDLHHWTVTSLVLWKTPHEDKR